MFTKKDPPNPAHRAVFITGATGRVAKRVISLLSQQSDLHLLDLQAGEVDSRPVIGVDLLDRDATINAMRGARAVVHFAIAGYTDVDDVPNSPSLIDYERRMLDVNIKGTYHVFEAARIHSISKVIYISSMTIPMGHGLASDLSEGLPPKPTNLYACTKLFGEQLGELYSRIHGIRTISLRLGHPYRPDDPIFERPQNDPRELASLVAFADIARAVDCALRADHVQNGIYNVVSRNADGYINFSSGREIGFEPQEYCPESGAIVHPINILPGAAQYATRG